MTLADQLPYDVAEVYFALRWTDTSLQQLRADLVQVPVADLEGQLDLAYWATAPPERVFDLTPRRILDDPGLYPGHTARIEVADLQCPLRLTRIHGTVMVLDGLHRLARAVREGVQTLPAAFVSVPRLRPLTLRDVPQLHGWLHKRHVLDWWHEPMELAAVYAKYAPRIAGEEPTHVHVIEHGGVDVGFIQGYRWADYPAHAATIGAALTEVGLDLAIGDVARCGQGLGPSVICAFVDRVLFRDGTATACVVDPEAANVRSIRAFEKAGFEAVAQIEHRLILRRTR